ncbi:MAG: ferric reductase-like transmembrane domain-containing protein [Dehalococcoidia bacterium]|nr:ferric reductase-like transmembrane domain-containing protein [Dehalococcoidia bacterium]
MTDVNIPWYLSRSTGMVAYLLLFTTVMLGLSIRTRALDRLAARWRVTDLHLFLSTLMLVFVGVHAAILLADSYIGFSLVQVLVPFTGPYRNLWTGLGIVGAYLLLVIALSFLVRRRIGYRAWRGLHYATFVAYLAALGHGVFAGTDSTQAWAQAIYVGTALLVAGFVVGRVALWARGAHAQAQAAEEARAATPVTFVPGRPARPGPLAAAMAASERRRRDETIRRRAGLFSGAAVAAVAALLVAWGAGPFKWTASGNAEGGPADQLAVSVAPGGDFSEPFRGNVASARDPATGGLRLTGTLHGQGAHDVTLRFDLSLESRGRRQTVTANTASLTAASGSVLCSGSVVRLDDGGVAVDCQGAGPYAGQTLTVTGSFDGGDERNVAGTLAVEAAHTG